MPPKPPKDQSEIDKADKSRLEDILKKKQGTDPSYKAAYEYAVKNVMEQIDRLEAFKDPKRDPYRAYILAGIIARNLDTLNQNASTPMVQFDFTFNNGKGEIKVKLDYDNPGHDPAKTLDALIGQAMEKQPKWKWDKVKDKKAKKIITELPTSRWRIYPHFGWNLSCKGTNLGGHSYITFEAMLMERASRPKDVETDVRINHGPFTVPPKDGMTCVNVGHNWKDYPAARSEMRIDENIQAAEKFINGLDVPK